MNQNIVYVGIEVDDVNYHGSALDKAECERKTHWRTHHNGWPERTVEGCSGSLKVSLLCQTPQHYIAI